MIQIYGRAEAAADMAQRGIAGRGVLLDYRLHAQKKGLSYSPFEKHAITMAELLDVMKEERIDKFESGDILLIRTGD